MVAAVTAWVAVAAAAPATAQPAGFDDVAEDAYYSVPVAALAEMGIFAGTECAQGFCPGEPIDRKTMAVWMVRVLDEQEPSALSESRFDDVDARSFHAPFIERIAELGVTRGCGDGSGFCPDSVVSRAQMAVFLTRAYGLPAGPDPGFLDVPGDAWYAAAVASLAASGITVDCSDGTVFCPERDTSRAHMATFIHRAENPASTSVGVDAPRVEPRGGTATALAALTATTMTAPATLPPQQAPKQAPPELVDVPEAEPEIARGHLGVPHWNCGDSATPWIHTEEGETTCQRGIDNNLSNNSGFKKQDSGWALHQLEFWQKNKDENCAKNAYWTGRACAFYPQTFNYDTRESRGFPDDFGGNKYMYDFSNIDAPSDLCQPSMDCIVVHCVRGFDVTNANSGNEGLSCKQPRTKLASEVPMANFLMYVAWI